MAPGKDAPPPLPMYERIVLKHVPTMVRRRYDRDHKKKLDDSTDQGLPPKDSESKGDDELEDANSPTVIIDEHGFIDDEDEDELSHENFDEQDRKTCTYDFGYSDFGPSAKDSTSESGVGAEDENLASFNMDSNNVEDKIEDDGYASIDQNDQDGAVDVNTFSIQVDASVKNEIQDNEQEDSKSESGVQGEVQDKDHGNFENEQGLHLEDNESKCESNGTEKAVVASYNLDDAVQDNVREEDHGYAENNEHELKGEDSKSKDGGSKDAHDISYKMDDTVKDEVLDIKHENFDGKPVVSPKAFNKSLEQDGYDLYCPKCKSLITRTMIFRRREDCQHYSTTCYSFLVALFCCNRW